MGERDGHRGVIVPLRTIRSPSRPPQATRGLDRNLRLPAAALLATSADLPGRHHPTGQLAQRRPVPKPRQQPEGYEPGDLGRGDSDAGGHRKCTLLAVENCTHLGTRTLWSGATGVVCLAAFPNPPPIHTPA